MKNNIVFLGCSLDFGHQFSATNTKIELLAQGLQNCNDNCLFINSLVGNKVVDTRTLVRNSQFNIVTYPKKFHQLLSWLLNLNSLSNDLKSFRQISDNNIIIVESPDYHLFLTYFIFSKLYNYKLIAISHEWGPTVSAMHWIRRPSVWLYSKTFGYLVDGILPISEYIIERIKCFNVPYIKLPILGRFNEEIIKNSDESNNYFVYCVYAAYTRVIFIILDAYKKYLETGGSKKLIMVLSGSDSQMNIIIKYIYTINLTEEVVIKNKLSYAALINTFINADALIIPLDPQCDQDYARFPQKIGEYLSSKTPIITNLVGEIKYYFIHLQDAIIVEYSIEGFCKSFHWIDKNLNLSIDIGERGYELGKYFFDFNTNAKKINNFLLEI